MRVVTGVCVAVAMVWATMASAEKGTFSISVGGIRAGTMAYDADESGGSYKINASARSSGLVGRLINYSADAAASGRVKGNTYQPSFFTESIRDSDGTETRTFRYRNGAPVITRTPEPDYTGKRRSYHLDPAKQSGTLDPLTTAYSILRDRPKDLACKLDIDTFDGERRARIRFREAVPTRDGIKCNALYTRVGGFSEKERRQKSDWPFSVEYKDQGGGVMQVEKVSVPTTFGSVVFKRR